MKTEFALIWLQALEKSQEPLTAMDPDTWNLFQILPVKTAHKKNGTVLFYYVPREQLITAIRNKYNLRKKCTLKF